MPTISDRAKKHMATAAKKPLSPSAQAAKAKQKAAMKKMGRIARKPADTSARYPKTWEEHEARVPKLNVSLFKQAAGTILRLTNDLNSLASLLAGNKNDEYRPRIEKILSLLKINDVHEAQTNMMALLRAAEKKLEK